MNIVPFKIRCSAIGSIMGSLGGITEKQSETLLEYEAKPKLTDKQRVTLEGLIKKRDAPPTLSVGAKTYCQLWLKEQIYSRRKEFSNRFTEKGTTCEVGGIDLTCQVMDYGMLSKNEELFEDEYMLGTPDVLPANIVEDIKNSWSTWTFPLFDTEIPQSDYEWQIRGYMNLCKRTKGAVNYCLIDAPEEIIMSEARFVSRKAGFEEIDVELYDEVKQKMTYSDVPTELKFKRFEFEHDETLVQAIRDRVILCRAYINNELLPTLKTTK